jgi:hypothetical protein
MIFRRKPSKLEKFKLHFEALENEDEWTAKRWQSKVFAGHKVKGVL